MQSVAGKDRLLELAALVLLLFITCFPIFGILPIWLDILTFVVLAFVTWAALRFGAGVTALSIFLRASIATVETTLGHGPFRGYTPVVNGLLLDTVIGVVAIRSLILGAVCAEWERSLRRQAALEMRVHLSTIVESSDDAIISKNLDGVIESWNKAAERIVGFSGSPRARLGIVNLDSFAFRYTDAPNSDPPADMVPVVHMFTQHNHLCSGGCHPHFTPVSYGLHC